MKYIKITGKVYTELPFGIALEFSSGRRVFQWQAKCNEICLHSECWGRIRRSPKSKWVCIKKFQHFFRVDKIEPSSEAEYLAEQL